MVPNAALVLTAPFELECMQTPLKTRAGGGRRVTVKMDYSSVQPLDGEMFAGRLGPPPGPGAVLGSEGVGHVLESSDEEKFPVGSRVAFVFRRFGEQCGCWMREVTFDLSDVLMVRIPLTLESQTVAAGITSTLLAVTCLRHFKFGDLVVVVPACGAVGLALLQLALLQGLHVVGLVRGSERAVWASLQYGATGKLTMIDIVEDGWPALLRAVCEGADGASGLIDGCGGDVLLQVSEVVQPRGVIVRFGGVAGEADEAALRDLAKRRCISVVRECTANFLNAADAEHQFEKLLCLMSQGSYKPHCWAMIDWLEVKQCMLPQKLGSRFVSQLSSGNRVGRIIFKFS